MQKFTDLLAEDARSLLQQHLVDGAIFLTPNTRLASQVRELLDALQAPSLDNSFSSVWQSPEVLPFEQWLSKKFNAAQLSGNVAALQLLTPAEELALWQQVVANSSIGDETLALSAAVSESQKAYNLLREWQIDLHKYRFEFQAIPDCQVFYDWVPLFEALSMQRKVVAWADAKQSLLAVDSGIQTKKIILVGFQKLTPLQEALVIKYAANHAPVQFSLSCECKSTKLYAAQNFEEEVRAAAIWAQGILQNDLEAKVGIVVKDLEQHKLLVERVMLETFESESFLRAQMGSSARFNISAGTALSQTAVVAVFLNLLEGLFKSLSLSYWQRILTSPYLFNTASKVNLASKVLTAMHQSGESSFKLDEIPRLLAWHYRVNNRVSHHNNTTNDESVNDSLSIGAKEEHSFAEDKIFQQVVDQLRALNRDVKQTKLQRPSSWLAKVQKIIALFAWPNERVLDSNEYQQWKRFLESVEAFQRFDKVLGVVTLQEACAKFKTFCHSVVFHRETTTDPSGRHAVQVLGMLEASGQLFDHLWLVGMSDRQWPLSVNPHPMIPLALQYDQAMPSASVEVELNYARRLTYDFLHAATHIVASYPKQIDEVNAVLSPLLEQTFQQLSLVPETIIADISIENKTVLSGSALANQTFEYIADHVGQPWPEIENNGKPALSGGVSTIQDFASNPLRAYARRRLRIEPLKPVVDGVSALERGNLVHQVLEGVWGELCGSQTLHIIDANECGALIDKQLSNYIDAIFSRRFIRPGSKLVDLECLSVKRLIEHWLLLEKKRPAFEVYALEKTIEADIGGFKIKGRIDRVDRLEDGQLLLIDYKIGAIRANAWLESPLTAIQLPFYAVALNNDSVLSTNEKPTNQKSVNPISTVDKNSRLAEGYDEKYDSEEHDGEEDKTKTKVVAIALASLKPGYLKMQGYCDGSSAAIDIAGVKLAENHPDDESISWQSLEQNWLSDIRHLVEGIHQGHAALDLLQHTADELYEPFIRAAFSETDEHSGYKA